jgi:hypothetical protein
MSRSVRMRFLAAVIALGCGVAAILIAVLLLRAVLG